MLGASHEDGWTPIKGAAVIRLYPWGRIDAVYGGTPWSNFALCRGACRQYPPRAMIDNETGEIGLDSDAQLRALVSRWDYDRSARELVAMGKAALERILDASDGHGSLDEPGADGRQYEDGLHAAVAAFAAQDMDRVLAAMKARRWDDTTIAFSGIARVPDARVPPFLKSAFASKDAFTRQRAVTLLGMQRGAEAVTTLVTALSDRSSDVRIAAIDALAEVGDPAAIPPLEALAKRSARSAYQAKRIEVAIAKIHSSS